jgi:hypothetical protein
VEPHSRKVALFESARRSGDAPLQVYEPADGSQSSQEVQVFEDGKRTKAADGIVNRTAYEYPGISVAEVQIT